jgi:hypothetical protein
VGKHITTPEVVWSQIIVHKPRSWLACAALGTEPGRKAGRTGHTRTSDTPRNDGGPVAEAEDGARDRRKFLTKGLATGAAALGAWTLASAQPAHAATDGDMILGRNNTAGERTALFMDANPYSLPGFYSESAGQGAAIEGDSTGGGPGVLGRTESGTGVANPGVAGQAPSDFGVGVYGTSDIGVQGDSPGTTSTQVGVRGTAAGPKGGVGVQGTGFKGVEGTSGSYGVYGAGFFGVYGLSPVGAGVFGDSSAAAVPGMLANNQVSGGIALSVLGFPSSPPRERPPSRRARRRSRSPCPRLWPVTPSWRPPRADPSR